jgi:F0F1-type ATP synthase membrane subunit b/b'
MSSAQAAQMLAMYKKQLDKAQASGNTQIANAILQQIALQEKKITKQPQPVMPGA